VGLAVKELLGVNRRSREWSGSELGVLHEQTIKKITSVDMLQVTSSEINLATSEHNGDEAGDELDLELIEAFATDERGSRSSLELPSSDLLAEVGRAVEGVRAECHEGAAEASLEGADQHSFDVEGVVMAMRKQSISDIQIEPADQKESAVPVLLKDKALPQGTVTTQPNNTLAPAQTLTQAAPGPYPTSSALASHECPARGTLNAQSLAMPSQMQPPSKQALGSPPVKKVLVPMCSHTSRHVWHELLM